MPTISKIIKTKKKSQQVLVLLQLNQFCQSLMQYLLSPYSLLKEKALVKNQPFVNSFQKKITFKYVLVKHSLNMQMKKKINLHVRLILLFIGLQINVLITL
ncbi:unnamed protein product [Paramecium primaurelia]|uniref:Transmembrane protein n=1 Tax=Paramecium primaurelia TaxID=5886 RepID=A0A8S1QQV2_PARPR|nr:unnamed protein product [Paramecium primaurelia]